MQNEWDNWMEQAFNLIYHSRLRYSDLNNMTGEEREWWLKRLKKQKDDEREASEN